MFQNGGCRSSYSSSQSEIGKPDRKGFSEVMMMIDTSGAEYSSLRRETNIGLLFIFYK